MRAMKAVGFIAIGITLAGAAPAFAQVTETLPRFEALEQQTQMLEQRRLDNLESQRQQELIRPVTPNSPITGADKALRVMEIEREMDRVRLQGDLERAQVQRERNLANAALPNRRIASHSSLVIRDPERYILPPAPKGQYYARIEGRFVLVDAASELVVKVLDPLPTDPTADVPAGPRPPLQPPLPAMRIGPDSPYVIREPARLSLPAAPHGQYYALVDGRVLLVDAKTERAVKAVRG
jgi:Ni/Co efflux regulator RcnB